MVAPLALFLGSALGMGLAGRAKAKKQRGLLNRELKTLSDVLDLQPETRTRSITLPSFEEDLSLDEVKDPMQIDGMNVGGGLLQPKSQPMGLKPSTFTSSFEIENPLIREARENPRTLGILREAQDLQTKGQLGLIKPPSTDDTIEYGFYVDQEKTAGRVPISFIEWQKKNKTPGTTVNVNTKDGDLTPLQEYQVKRQDKTFESIDEKTNSVRDLLPYLQQQRQNVNLADTGSFAPIKQSVLGILDEFNLLDSKTREKFNATENFAQLNNLLAPRLRVSGSGSTSDLEFKAFKQSVGAITDSELANKMQLQFLIQLMEREVKYGMMKKDYLETKFYDSIDNKTRYSQAKAEREFENVSIDPNSEYYSGHIYFHSSEDTEESSAAKGNKKPVKAWDEIQDGELYYDTKTNQLKIKGELSPIIGSPDQEPTDYEPGYEVENN